MDRKSPEIKIQNKETERPIVKVRNIPMNKSSENFAIKDDNSSGTESVASYRISTKKKNKKKLREFNAFPSSSKQKQNDEKFDIYANPKKRVKQKIIDESEDDSEGDSDSDDESEVSGITENTDDSSASGESDSSKNSGPKMSWKEVESKKQDYLLKLQDLESKGFKLTKHFNMKSDLEDMKLEYERHRKLAERDATVKFSRKMLMACVTGMEYLNGRFDPFNVKLNGWSETVMESLGDYDRIFERLSEKYAGKAEMAPELELMLSLAGSAFMFHLTNSLFKNAIPGMGDVVKKNPELMANIAKAMSQSANSSEPAQSGGGQNSMAPPNFDMGSLMSSLMGGGGMGGNAPRPSRPVPDTRTQSNVSIPHSAMSVPMPNALPASSRQTDSAVYNDNDRFSDVSSEYSSGSDININIPKKTRSKKSRSINI
jgi:hypothetical protein